MFACVMFGVSLGNIDFVGLSWQVQALKMHGSREEVDEKISNDSTIELN